MKKIVTLILLGLNFNSFAQIANAPENISPLLIGEKIPNTLLHDINGEQILTDKLFSKKTVLIVYRGGWCPYCNSQLADLQEIENQIIKLGFQVVAVSPDAPSFLKQTEEKKELNYKLFSDSEGVFSKAIGIVFSAPEKYSKMLGKYSDDKNNSWLPVPTVYIINEKQEIEFMYINPNYASRLSGNLLLAVLKTL